MARSGPSLAAKIPTAGGSCTGWWSASRRQQGAYLALLPDEFTFYVPGTQPLRVAHGVPGRNRVGFYRSQSDAAIAAEIEHVRERR